MCQFFLFWIFNYIFSLKMRGRCEFIFLACRFCRAAMPVCMHELLQSLCGALSLLNCLQGQRERRGAQKERRSSKKWTWSWSQVDNKKCRPVASTAQQLHNSRPRLQPHPVWPCLSHLSHLIHLRITRVPFWWIHMLACPDIYRHLLEYPGIYIYSSCNFICARPTWQNFRV